MRARALALLLACACDGRAHDETKVETIPAHLGPKPAEAPPLPAGDPAYELWVGPAVSATDPRLVDRLDRVPIGYVGIAFRLVGSGSFAVGEIEVTLEMLEPSGTFTEITRKRAQLAATEDIFYKSWKLSQPGTFQVTVSDPKREIVLAAQRFEVASDAARTRQRTQVSPAYELTVGPASSPSDPQPLETKTKLPIGYVGLRFAPPIGQHFTMARIEVTLWRVLGETRVLEARKVSELGEGDDVFYKSWDLHATGIYEVEVAAPDSDALYASTRFEVVGALQ